MMNPEPELVVAFVEQFPHCDFDASHDLAVYDAVTRLGPWAFMCELCYQKYGTGRLGTGIGQRLMLKERSGE